MNISDENEIKKEFQLERVVLFSDAVFAIIITIMVLDIRLPEGLRHATSAQAQQAFIQLLPKMFAYCFSFFLVSKFWRSHLKIFSLLKDYDSRLLSLNLLYLFSVSLFPFAVSLTSGNISLESPQFAWACYTYIGIFLFCTFSQTVLATYLVHNQHKLCFNTNNLDKILRYKAMRLNFFFIPAVIGVTFGLNYFAVPPLYATYVLAVYGLAMSRFLKKFYPEKENNRAILSRLFRSRKGKLVKPETVTEPVADE
jgi:uncharacterized membrane protein